MIAAEGGKKGVDPWMVRGEFFIYRQKYG